MDMKFNTSTFILTGVIFLAIVVFGLYPIYVRKACLNEARALADSVASAESGLLQKGMDIKSANYSQLRDDRYSQCLAEHGL